MSVEDSIYKEYMDEGRKKISSFFVSIFTVIVFIITFKVSIAECQTIGDSESLFHVEDVGRNRIYI